MSPRPVGRRRDSGSISAELALALPALTIALAAALGVVQVSVAQMRCIDAARAGARLAARGETSGLVSAVTAAAAAPNSTVAVSIGAQTAVVGVSSRVALSLPGRPSISLTCRAQSAVEAGLP